MNSKRRSGKVIIGTRGSPLALAQANEVKEKIINLNNLDPEKINIKIIKTSGERFMINPFRQCVVWVSVSIPEKKIASTIVFKNS